MIKLKKITNKSWLLLTDDLSKLGLLTEQPKGLVLLISDSKTTFKSRSEINEFFNEDIFQNIIEREQPKSEFYVNGYPVKHVEPYRPKDSSDLPIYAKNKTSDVYYAAGYYCIETDRGPFPVYCPKVSTLVCKTYHGPFKTEEEMKLELSVLKKSYVRN